MAARLSAGALAGRAGHAAQRRRPPRPGCGACQADAAAYGLVIAALRSPREARIPGNVASAWRRRCLRPAEVPAELAEIGADVAAIALRIAEAGNQNLLGDVVTAALLAEAGSRAAELSRDDQPRTDARR